MDSLLLRVGFCVESSLDRKAPVRLGTPLDDLQLRLKVLRIDLRLLQRLDLLAHLGNRVFEVLDPHLASHLMFRDDFACLIYNKAVLLKNLHDQFLLLEVYLCVVFGVSEGHFGAENIFCAED